MGAEGWQIWVNYHRFGVQYEELSSAPTWRLSEVWKRSASGLVSVQERVSCDDSCGKPYGISECLSRLPGLLCDACQSESHRIRRSTKGHVVTQRVSCSWGSPGRCAPRRARCS